MVISKETNQFPFLSRDWLSHIFIPLSVLVLGTALWLLSLPSMDIRNVNHLGLVSIFTPLTFIGMMLVNISFVLGLRSEDTPNWVRVLQIIVIIIMLHGVTALIEALPRFSINYVHIGFSDYISRTGSLATDFDARFSWPGFFALTAFVDDIAGLDLQTIFTFLSWAHVIFNLLYVAVIWIIARAIFENIRPAWLTVWLFASLNWIGQDYFSPQALGFFFYLVVAAILVKWFKGLDQPNYDVLESLENDQSRYPTWLQRIVRIINQRALFRWLARLAAPVDPESTPSTPRQRMGLIFVIIMIFVAVVSSHQLTPFFMLATLMGWVIFYRVRRMWFLPILLGFMTLAWISFMTLDFLAGNIISLIAEIGQVSDVASANVSERLINSTPEREIVLQVRLVMSLGIWGLAGLSVLRRFIFARKIDWTILIAAGAPFPVLLLQSYGGEMALRIYFFSLPFMAMLITYHFNLKPRLLHWFQMITLIVLLNVSLIGFLIARHGNEIMDYVTPEEFEVVEYTYDIAPTGSMLVTFSPNMIYRHRRATDFDLVEYDATYRTLDELKEEAMRAEEDGEIAFILLTRGAAAAEELLSGFPPGWAEEVWQEVREDNSLIILYETQDAQLSVLASSLYWQTNEQN